MRRLRPPVAEDGTRSALDRLVDLRQALGLSTGSCHPAATAGPSVSAMAWTMRARWMVPVLATAGPGPGELPAGVALAVPSVADDADVDAIVVQLFRAEGLALVRLARLFVDDRNAAEDLVQEAFIRLARSVERIRNPEKAAAYLRSIVLNLARDHNRRGLVSLRHQLPLREPVSAAADEDLELREDQREVLEALRELPRQQRNCVVLRHLEERPVAAIAETLGISENSVKTHLKRGMAALATRLEEPA